MLLPRLSFFCLGVTMLGLVTTAHALPARFKATPTPSPSTGPATVTTERPLRGEAVAQAPRTSTVRTEAATQSTRSSTVRTEPVAQGPRPSTIVVIDPGHGGFDRGGIPGQRVPEKTMNLDVSLRLRSILAANGYRVVMTRDSDVFIPLPTRVAIANSYRNAIFVCIHFNSATRSGANGIETYFYSRESLSLASAIHYHVAGGAPSLNRGVRRRGYYVLRRTSIPAILVECGFLTNPTEAQYAQSSNYRQKLAEEIARGIRGRGNVGGMASSSPTRSTVASGTVPLQPFIDQTRVRDPDLSRSKRSGKRSRSKSAKSRRSSSDSSEKKSSSKKKSTKKHKSSSDDDEGGTRKKKTKSSKKSED